MCISAVYRIRAPVTSVYRRRVQDKGVCKGWVRHYYEEHCSRIDPGLGFNYNCIDQGIQHIFYIRIYMSNLSYRLLNIFIFPDLSVHLSEEK